MDGTIEAYWNLVDTNGVPRTNATTDPWFDSIFTVADPVSVKTPRKDQRPQRWPDHGQWTIAYQDYFKFEYSQNNAQQGALNAFLSVAARFGGYLIALPGQTNPPGQTYPMRYQKTNHWDPTITQQALDDDTLRLYDFLARTNSRNFYYDGHGTAGSLGDIPSVFLGVLIN